jgi:hypothetical protein
VSSGALVLILIVSSFESAACNVKTAKFAAMSFFPFGECE